MSHRLATRQDYDGWRVLWFGVANGPLTVGGPFEHEESANAWVEGSDYFYCCGSIATDELQKARGES